MGKQILKTQKQRLSKEKNKLQKNEDNNENINIGNEIKRLQSIDAQRFGKSKPVKPEEHGHVFTDYMKKLKDGLLMHQTLKTAEHAVVKIKHALSDQLELEKARNKQMFGQQYGEENDPFGGAFGGSLSAPSDNPYNNGFAFSLTPPPPPMPFGQFSNMLQTMMNPLQLPSIPGLRGQYAQRRRIINDDIMYKAVIKCTDDGLYTICIEYDWENDLLSVDVNILNETVLKKENEDDLEYYFVYDFYFRFDDDDIDDEQCQFYNDENAVCIQRFDENVSLYYYDDNGKKQMFDYRVDEEWNEIYKGQLDKKCVNWPVAKMCLTEKNVNEYKVEMHFAKHRLSNHKH